MDCGTCSRELFSPKKTAKCSQCKLSFHPSCTRLQTVENYKKMRKEAKDKWKCDRCKDGKKSVSDDNYDSENDDEDVVQPTKEFRISGSPKSSHGEVSPKSSHGEVSQDIMSEINRKLGNISTMVDDMRELKASVSYMSAQFDKFVEEMSKIKSDVNLLVRENSELKLVVTDLQHKVDLLEQNSRDANIELHGVPESSNEDCIAIVKETSKVLQIESGIIKKAFRVGPPNNNRPRKILAELCSAEERDNLVRAARTNRNLTADKLFKDWPANRIYVNENLTSFRMELLRRAKTKAKERGIKFVWVKNSVIHVRKAEGECVKTIRSLEDVDSL
ncbi:hypothetical protein GE061_007907 [Apolygus lucorum]|uniref:PHD-type domain-containing protein n=1 Tax=Apolygus lucorum TaxID=248454 RepID=A0A8S9WM47_APOLU|nr:hypothetical protein GE061_007907 [Apolygus lucorum]